MYNVILIEQIEEYRRSVEQALESSGIRLHIATNMHGAKELITQLKNTRIDLMLLDFVLPDGDGLLLLDHLQSNEQTRDIPVVVITSNQELSSKVAAFNMGADDYLLKPVHPIELRTRIESKIKKTLLKRKVKEHIKRGDLVLNTEAMQSYIVTINGQKSLDLTNKEFKILAHLAINEGTVFSRPQLVNQIWGNSVQILDRTIDSHICSLRRKLGSIGHYIECVPCAGYRFNSQT